VKVDSITSSNVQASQSGAQRTQPSDSATASSSSAGKAPSPPTESPAGDANVNLSGLSSSLRELAISGAADIDVAKVESIKQAIKNGTLKIDTSKIADGILETARDLLRKRPPDSG
jgi:negative regulator of flagellin synthesis FlgM